MKWRWRYQKYSMWCQKICRKCWYRCKCRQKKRAHGETYPPVKGFLHCQIFKYGTFVDSFKMGHFILLYTVETQKFHLEHCKIKADFTLNVLLVRISVLCECFMCKMLDHIALLRAIKKNQTNKKKTFSRPTDPAPRRASMDKQTIFFSWPNGQFVIIKSNSNTHCQVYGQVMYPNICIVEEAKNKWIKTQIPVRYWSINVCV